MGENTVQIFIEGKDGLSRPAQSAASALGSVDKAAGSAHRSLGGLGSVFASVATQAAGFGAALIGVQALSGIGGMVKNTIGGMLSASFDLEQMGQSFKVLLSDAAAAGGGVQDSGNEMAASVQSSAASVANAQERMADAAEDHELALAELATSFEALGAESTKNLAKMAAEYQSTLADMSASHTSTMGDLRRQLEEYTVDFARQSGERNRRFDEEIAQRRQQLDRELSEIKRRYDEAAKTAPDRFLQEKDAAKRNSEFLTKAIADEEAKGVDADRSLLASLRQRLRQEETLQARTFTQFQAVEKAKLVAEQNAATTRASAEESALRRRYEVETGLASEANAQRIAEFQRRMAKEEAEYSASVAKREGSYNEDLAAYQEREAEKIETLKKRSEQEQKQWLRTSRDAKQAIEQATAAFGRAATSTTSTVRRSVNQMAEMYRNLGVLSGKEMKTAEDRTAAMLEFITKKAKETPFEIPDIQEMVLRLISYRLDATQFLDTVGNVAAGMKKPLGQVADAFGRLATGQLGQAVEAFQFLGVNIRDVAGLTFDAQGAIVTPTEEALAAVKEAMDVRFGGMMAAQMKTARGLISNVRDAWTQLQLVVGEPIREELKKSLASLMKWIDDNDAKLKDFGKTLGEMVGSALRDLAPQLKELMAGFLEYVSSGRAKTDLLAFGGEMRSVAKSVGEVADMIRQLKRWYDGLVGTSKFTWSSLIWDSDFAAKHNGTVWDNEARAWTERWQYMEGVSDAFWDGVGLKTQETVGAISATWNGMIDGIGKGWETAQKTTKDAINSMIEMFNNLIRAWNALSFTMPVIPLPLGGSVGGWTVGVPGIPEIPKLDKGGIVTGPTLAALAVNGRPEAVVPLDRAGVGVTVNYYQQAPVYGFANFEDSVVGAIERAQRRGRL